MFDRKGGNVTDKEAKEKIFNTIIGCEICLNMVMYGPDFACVPISNILGLIPELKRSQARRAIKELINDGLIFYTSQGRPAIESGGEYRELVCEAAPPINGYALTKSGFKSAAYKAAYDEWKASLEEWAEE